MCGAEDQWVKSAMADDTIVVDLLLRLHGTAAPRGSVNPAALPLEWSVRQRRSVAGNPKKQAQRASPTTPLSFSCGASFSGGSGGSGGGAGGFEESSSRPSMQKLPASAARSKVNSEGEKSASKRSRKKTLPELKDEQRSLLQEKRELNRGIAVLRSDLEKQRIVNANLKRMKVELQPSPDKETSIARESNSEQPRHPNSLHTIAPSVSSDNVMPQPAARRELNADSASNPKFELPDLNLPFEESPCPEVTCGVS